MNTIINLTPHALVIVGADGAQVRRIEPSAPAARCTEERVSAGCVDGIPLIRKRFGQVVDLPEPKDGVLYIVSALAALGAWAQGRADVVCPGDPVRNAEGQITGCKSLCVAP